MGASFGHEPDACERNAFAVGAERAVNPHRLSDDCNGAGFRS
jgi:hypothetical protein